jgi:hypothetical protein
MGRKECRRAIAAVTTAAAAMMATAAAMMATAAAAAAGVRPHKAKQLYTTQEE